MAISDYDVVTSFDSAVDTEAGTALKEEKYFVPKIIGEGLKDTPDTPLCRGSGHYLTIQDSRFYKGTDPNIVFKGTVDSKTSHFKIIVNLPTDLYVSGVRIVRGFVIYETKLTNDDHMVISGNKWTLTIPADDEVFNSVYSSMLSCPVCYLTAITTDENDETYGDEAIFDWMAPLITPTISSPNEYNNSIYIDTIDNLITLNIDVPSGIPGDTIEIIDNSTNETQNITVTKEMVDYNKIYQVPNYKIITPSATVYRDSSSPLPQTVHSTGQSISSPDYSSSLGYGVRYVLKKLYTTGLVVDYSVKLSRIDANKGTMQSPITRRIFNISRFNHNSTGAAKPFPSSSIINYFAPTSTSDKLIPLYVDTDRTNIMGYVSAYGDISMNYTDAYINIGRANIDAFPGYIISIDESGGYWCTKSDYDYMVSNDYKYLYNYRNSNFIRVLKYNDELGFYETICATFLDYKHSVGNALSDIFSFTVNSNSYIVYSCKVYDETEYNYFTKLRVYKVDINTKFIQLIDSVFVSEMIYGSAGNLAESANPISVNDCGDVVYIKNYYRNSATSKVCIFKFDPVAEKYMAHTTNMPLVTKQVTLPDYIKVRYYDPYYSPISSMIIGNKLVIDYMLCIISSSMNAHSTDNTSLLAYCDAGRLTQEYSYESGSWLLTNEIELQNSKETFNSFEFDVYLYDPSNGNSSSDISMNVSSVKSKINTGGVRYPSNKIKYSPNKEWVTTVEVCRHVGLIEANTGSHINKTGYKYINTYKKNELGIYEYFSRVDVNANDALLKIADQSDNNIMYDINDAGEIYYLSHIKSLESINTRYVYYYKEDGSSNTYYTIEYDGFKKGSDFYYKNNSPVILFKCKPTQSATYDVEYFTFSDDNVYDAYDFKNEKLGDAIVFRSSDPSKDGYIRYKVEDGIPFVYISLKCSKNTFSITKFVDTYDIETGEIIKTVAFWDNNETSGRFNTKIQVGNSANDESVPVSELNGDLYNLPNPEIITSTDKNYVYYLRNTGTLKQYPGYATYSNIKCAVVNSYGMFSIDIDGVARSTSSVIPLTSLNGVTGLKDISINGMCVMVLTKDNTVLYAGESPGFVLFDDVQALTNVKSIYATPKYFVAVKMDGTLYVDGSDNTYGQIDNARLWTDITSVVCTDQAIVGLKSDGTVVMTGVLPTNIGTPYGEWTDIVQLASNSTNLLGLRKDGTLVYTGGFVSTSITDTASSWSGLIHVACNNVCWYGINSVGVTFGAGDSSYYTTYWNMKL